jgi:hypothetical protein
MCDFEGGCKFPFEHVDTLYSVLATLLALESISLSNRNESTRAHHESLTELFRVPSLRSVCFEGFSFTPDVYNGECIDGRYGITNLEFTECKFSTGKCAAIMSNGLGTINGEKFLTQLDFVKSQGRCICMLLPPGYTSIVRERHLRCFALQMWWVC